MAELALVLYPRTLPAADATRFYVADMDGQVIATDHTLSTKWVRAFPGERFVAPPVKVGTSLLVGSSTGIIRVLSATTGDTVSEVALGASIRGLAAYGTRAVALLGASDTRLVSLTFAPLAAVAEVALEDAVVDGPTIRIGQGGQGDTFDRVWIADSAGRVRNYRWSDLGDPVELAVGGRLVGRPALASNSDVVAASVDGVLARVRLQFSGGVSSLVQIWSNKVGSGVDTQPVIAAVDAGLGVFAVVAGRLKRFDAMDGALLWTCPLATRFLPVAPVVGNYGEIYAASENAVATVNTKDGNIRSLSPLAPFAAAMGQAPPAPILLRGALSAAPATVVADAEDGTVRTATVSSTAHASGPFTGAAGGADNAATLSTFADPPYALPAPVFSVSPSSLSFTGSNIQAQTPGQTVMVTNSGVIGSRLRFTATADQPWVSFHPTTSDPAIGINEEIELRVATKPFGLTPGVHNATLTLTDATAGIFVDIPVTLTVAAPQSTMRATPISLFIEVIAGATASTILLLKNIGPKYSSLAWTATPSQAYITATPGSGTLSGEAEAGEEENITVTVNAAALAAGDYTANVTLTAPTTTNSPLVVPLTIRVNSEPSVLSVTPAFLSFNGKQGETLPAQGIEISNTAPATTKMFWNLPSPPAGFRFVGATSGSIIGGQSTTVTVEADTFIGVPGSYGGTISIDAGTISQGSPADVSLSLNLAAAPVIKPDPATLAVSGVQDSVPPANVFLTVRNAGALPLTLSATSDVPWVNSSYLPSSVTIQPGAETKIGVVIDVTALEQGTHTGHIVLAAPDTPNSPVSVTVVATIQGFKAVISFVDGALAFTATEGQGAVLPQTTKVANKGSAGSTLTVNLTAEGVLPVQGLGQFPWLFVSPAQLVLTAGVSKPILVGVVATPIPTWGGVLVLQGNVRAENAANPADFVLLPVQLSISP